MTHDGEPVVGTAEAEHSTAAAGGSPSRAGPRTAAPDGAVSARRSLVLPVLALMLFVSACGSSDTAPSATSEAATATPSVTASAAVPVSTTAAPSVGTASALATQETGMSLDAQTIVSGLSAAAGGLSDASQDCVVALLSEDPSLVETLLAAGGPVEGPTMLRLLACLTSEEAAALTPPGDDAVPEPTDVVCLMEALSDEPSGERILEVLTGADPSGTGLTVAESAILGEAVQACGIETEFGFGDPSSVVGSPSDDAADLGGGWGLCTEWLILYPGDMCDLDELTVTVEGGGAVLLGGNIDSVDVGGMRFDGDVVDIAGLLMAYDGAAWTINAVPQ